MPKKIIFLVTLLSMGYLAVLGFVYLHGSWISTICWGGLAFVILDIYWPRFDLGGVTLGRGNSHSNKIALTFDDGPDPTYTSALLDVLKKLKVKATFFVLGKHVEAHPEIFDRLVQEGHEVGSHGYSHTKYIYFTPSKIQEDLKKWEDIVLPRLRDVKPLLLRTPHGLKTPFVRQIAKRMGYQLVAWTRGVWDTDNPGVQHIVSKATKNVKSGEVILLHDGDGNGAIQSRAQTVEALPEIIQKLRDKGFDLATLSEVYEGGRKPVAWGRVFISTVLTLTLLGYVLKHFNIREILSHITIVSPLFLFASLGLDLCCLFVKSQAWRELVMPLEKVPRRRTFGIYLVGAMLNNILPFRAGDLGRSDLLKRQYEVSRMHGYSTVMLEGLINGLTILPILFFALLFFPLSAQLQKIFMFFTILMSTLTVIVMVISRKSDHKWLKGFQALQNKKNFWSASGFLFLGWILYLTSLLCMLKACGLPPTFWASPVLAIVLTASMFVPSAPGRLGTFEAAIILSLALFQIPKESALAFGLVLHSTQTFPVLLWGWIAWLFVGKKNLSQQPVI